MDILEGPESDPHKMSEIIKWTFWRVLNRSLGTCIRKCRNDIWGYPELPTLRGLKIVKQISKWSFWDFKMSIFDFVLTFVRPLGIAGYPQKCNFDTFWTSARGPIYFTMSNALDISINLSLKLFYLINSLKD